MRLSLTFMSIVVMVSILFSGCIEGKTLIGQSELTQIDGLKQEFVTQYYNLTVETSTEIMGETPDRKIVVNGNVTNHGDYYLYHVTFKSSFHPNNGAKALTIPVVSYNVYSLSPRETESFEIVYEEPYINSYIKPSPFDDIKKYKIEVYYP